MGLQKRGDLTVWLSNDALDAWRASPSGKPGGRRTYGEIAIEAALTIGMVFQLSGPITRLTASLEGRYTIVILPIGD